MSTAEKAYENLIALAQGIEDLRVRKLTLARATRFSAELGFPNSSFVAYLMMTAPAEGAQYSPGAISLIEDCELLNAWERLEKGDMHYFAALCAHEQGFVAAEPAQLGQAEAAYRRILIELSDRRRRWRLRFRQLRSKATKGVKRIAEARDGNYDANWLPS